MTIIVLALGLAAAYLLFQGALIALTRARVFRLNELCEANKFGACLARKQVRHAALYMTSCRVGLALALIFFGCLLSYIASLPFTGAAIGDLSLGWLEFGARVGTLSLAGSMVLLLILASVTLQRLALAYPEHVLRFAAPLLSGFAWVLFPITRSTERLVDRIAKICGLNLVNINERVASAEEISEIVAESGRAGQLDRAELRLIQRVFTFSDTIVREVMTPRKDIASVGVSATLQEASEQFISRGYSRLIVTDKSLDDVKGMLLAKDLLPFIISGRGNTTVSSVMRPISFVPNTKKTDDLLQEFRKERIHLAVVLDEHGGVDGVVSLEDLIEEIVGEILDEFDLPEENVKVRRSKSGDLIIDGGVHIEEVNQRYGYSFPLGAYDTIGGFLLQKAGRIPEPGEMLEIGGETLRVEEVANNRIRRVRILNPAKKNKGLAVVSSDPKKPETQPALSDSNPMEAVS